MKSEKHNTDHNRAPENIERTPRMLPVIPFSRTIGYRLLLPLAGVLMLLAGFSRAADNDKEAAKARREALDAEAKRIIFGMPYKTDEEFKLFHDAVEKFYQSPEAEGSSSVLEHLRTVALQRGEFALAEQAFRRCIAMPGLDRWRINHNQMGLAGLLASRYRFLEAANIYREIVAHPESDPTMRKEAKIWLKMLTEEKEQ